MSLLPTIMTLAASTAGIGAPQFNETRGESIMEWVNIGVMILVIFALFKNTFGKKEVSVSPSPISVKEEERFVTMREFKEVKARTIESEKHIVAIRDAIHDVELRLVQAGNEREHKIMERIDALVPEIARAIDRTDNRKGPGGARS